MAGLYEASLRGDVRLLKKLLRLNPQLPLDERFTGHRRTPLHIAAMCGHVKFAGELLGRNNNLATVTDSHGFTPLHLASARPCLSMVKLLLSFNTDVCIAPDGKGRTPLHLAAKEDRLKIIKELIQRNPVAIHKIQNGSNETILHFCVRHESLDCLKFLVEELLLMGAPAPNIVAVSINSQNADGNTVLHLAAELKRMKFIKYLLESKNNGIDINVENNNHVKALDMLTLTETERDNLEIGGYDRKKKLTTASNGSDPRWMLEKVNVLMVVATLVAGIAFQAANNPPGGVFQEDSKIKASENPVIFTYYLRSVAKSTKSSRFGRYLDQQQLNHSTNLINSTSFLQELLNTLNNDTYSPYSPYVMGKSPGIVMEHEKWNKIISKYKPRFSPYLIRYAGTPILAYKNPRIYNLYMTYNAIAFLVSLSIIVLVLCGFIDSKKSTNHQVRVLIGMMIVAITAWLLSFVSVFISMSPPFYINHPLLSQAFIISIVTLAVCMYGYHLLMLIKLKHWIKILWWKIVRKDRLIDQFQKEGSALDSTHHLRRLLSKAVILKFMPVFYFIFLATLSLPFLYSYTNRA